MEWSGSFGMEYGRYQNGMERKISRMQWKTIFHSNSILDFVHCIYRKIHTISKILSQKHSTSISTQIICRQIAILWLCTLRKQCTNCIIVSTLQFNCSIDVTVDDLDRFDLRLTFCPVENFVFLHRHENSYLLFYPRFNLILFIFLVFKLIVPVILFGVKASNFYYGKCSG